MKIYINPYKKFVGSFIPQWLEQMTGINPGAKLCYARLCRYAGKNGYAYPRHETLAESIGVSDRQVRRYLQELEEIGLIESKQIGFGKPNRYYFLDHEAMADNVTEPDRADMSEHEWTSTSVLDRTSTSGPIIEDNHIRESKEENIERDDTEKSVIEYLLKTFGNDFEIRPTGKYRMYIKQLIDEGKKFEQFKTVIDRRNKDYRAGKIKHYLVEPDVMFKPDLFIKELNAAKQPEKKDQRVKGEKIDNDKYKNITGL